MQLIHYPANAILGLGFSAFMLTTIQHSRQCCTVFWLKL